MMIRRRPLLLSLSSYYSSSSSLNPDPSLQQPEEEGRSTVDGEERRIELHPVGDLTSDPPLHQHLPPKSKQSQMHRVLDDSFPQHSLVTSDNNSSGAKVPLEWCNGVTEIGDGIKNSSFEKDGSFDGKLGKKKKRNNKSTTPAVVMEGSRCSRVNGRGWRCGQQTLVGYSLCEHHLGKGRLRSMSIVRKGHQSRLKPVGSEGEDDAGSGSGEKKGRRKKKKKIGTLMKAHSITSLLDETDHLAAATLTSLALSTLDR